MFNRNVTYRNFTIEVSSHSALLNQKQYFYTVFGNSLSFPIMSSVGEWSKQSAIDKAKEFIDEHLV